MKTLVLLLFLFCTATVAQDKPSQPSPIPQPDQLTDQDQQIAYLSKYVGKLQSKILEMQKRIDALEAENKALKEQGVRR